MFQDFLKAFPPPPFMHVWLAVIGLIIGLFLGSFATAWSWRRPRGLSILAPASNCPNCHTRLQPLDLVPVFSWLWMKGHCRYCRTLIDKRYPLIELVSGFAGMLITYFSKSVPGSILLFCLLPISLCFLIIWLENHKIDKLLGLLSLLILAIAVVAYLQFPLL